MKKCTRKSILTLCIVAYALLFGFICLLNIMNPLFSYADATADTLSEIKDEDTYYHQQPTEVDIELSKYNIVEI